MNRKTTKNFIKESKIIWNDNWNYSNTKYINNYTKVEIICKKHGSFWQIPNSHLKGINGCKKCDNERKKKEQTLNNKKFILKAKKIHGDLYLYNNILYKNAKKKIEIICKKHGSFFVTPDNFLNKKSGCTKCKFEINSKKRTYNTTIFIKKSKEINGDRYIYDKTIYKNNKTKIVLKCKEHGYFKQLPNNHITKKQGCPKCKESKGEKEVSKFLTENNINYEKEKRFKEIKKLRFDFYIKKYNLIIEYDGEQHFKPVDYFGGVEKYKKLKRNDKIKNNWCVKNNIKLIRIPYWNYKNIKNMLNDILK